MSWYWFIFILSLTVSIPIAIGFIVFKDLDKPGRFFLYLMLAILATELTAHFYRIYFGNNMIVLNLYTIVSAVLIGHYIYNLNKEVVMLYLFYSVALLAAGEIVVRGPMVLGNYSITVLGIVSLASLLYIFYQMALAQVNSKHLLISVSLFFYFMTNFAYFFTAGYLQRTAQIDHIMAMVITKGLTNAFCYGWYAIGIWRAFM